MELAISVFPMYEDGVSGNALYDERVTYDEETIKARAEQIGWVIIDAVATAQERGVNVLDVTVEVC